jgi:hypothetical protein
MKSVIAKYKNSYVLKHCARLMSWLPACEHSLSMLFSEALVRRDLNLEQRFILFQLERVRGLRESSSSGATDRLEIAKAASTITIQMMLNFWERTECNIGLLNVIAQQISNTKSLWHQAIKDFPNSLQFRDSYVTYLIEGLMSYQRAVLEQFRADMLQNRKDFRIDDCFRRFVTKFPEYLKKHIVDVHGNLIQNGDGSNSQVGAVASGVASEEMLDAGEEERLGKQLITLSRLRLTVERAFANHKPITYPYMIFVSAFCTCVCVVGIIVAYANYASYFDPRRDTASPVERFNDIRADFFGCILSWVYYWGSLTSTVVYESIVAPLNYYDWNIGGNHFHYFPLDLPWDETALIFNENLRSTYDEFMKNIVAYATSGGDVTHIAGPLFSSNSMSVRFCDEMGTPEIWFQGNLRTVWTYLFMQSSLFKSVDDTMKWFSENEPTCVVMSSLTLIADSLDALRTSLASTIDQKTQETSQELDVIGIALPLCMFVFTMVSLATVSFLYIREVNNFTSLLMKLRRDVKRECMKPLRRVSKPVGDVKAMFTVPKYSLPAIFNASVMIVLAACSATIFAQFQNIKSFSQLYFYLKFWSLTASTPQWKVSSPHSYRFSPATTSLPTRAVCSTITCIRTIWPRWRVVRSRL